MRPLAGHLPSIPKTAVTPCSTGIPNITDSPEMAFSSRMAARLIMLMSGSGDPESRNSRTRGPISYRRPDLSRTAYSCSKRVPSARCTSVFVEPNWRLSSVTPTASRRSARAASISSVLNADLLRPPSLRAGRGGFFTGRRTKLFIICPDNWGSRGMRDGYPLHPAFFRRSRTSRQALTTPGCVAPMYPRSTRRAALDLPAPGEVGRRRQTG